MLFPSEEHKIPSNVLGGFDWLNCSDSAVVVPINLSILVRSLSHDRLSDTSTIFVAFRHTKILATYVSYFNII